VEQKIRKWGSISVLSTIGGTLIGTLTIWLFGQAVNIQPMADSINKLIIVVKEANEINTKEHKVMVNKLHNHGDRLNITEYRLGRVIKDCKENGIEIKECIKDMK